MAAFQTFEEIIAWQKARVLTSAIYAVCREGEFSRDFGLRDQIRRASVSIMANIAEGFERATNREFHRFLSIAKGSAAEVRSHLYVALDASLITSELFKSLRAQAEEVGRVIQGLMEYLNSNGP